MYQALPSDIVFDNEITRTCSFTTPLHLRKLDPAP